MIWAAIAIYTTDSLWAARQPTGLAAVEPIPSAATPIEEPSSVEIVVRAASVAARSVLDP